MSHNFLLHHRILYKKGGIRLSSQGSVIARVYTSDAYIPLPNAPVVFSTVDPDGGKTLLAIRTTDSSGLTTPVSVETPDVDQSLSPGLSLKPYASISVQVSYPGFQSIQAEGVQVFPGVETIQGLQMQPITPTQSDAPMITPPQTPQNL